MTTYSGAYLGEIAHMASAEISPLSKHMTPKNVITITVKQNIPFSIIYIVHRHNITLNKIY